MVYFVIDNDSLLVCSTGNRDRYFSDRKAAEARAAELAADAPAKSFLVCKSVSFACAETPTAKIRQVLP